MEAYEEKRLMKNFEWCVYTYRHRKAFAYCVRKLVHEPSLRAEMLRRAKTHDMDKMIMYLFLDQKEAQKLHVQTKPHHLENNLPRTYEDYVEAVIDYECAPYTKPDKPQNAFDLTNLLIECKALDAKSGAKLMEIMQELGIMNSSSVSEDSEGHAFMAGIPNVTEEMIYREILEYINENRENELNGILEYINGRASYEQE